VAETTLSPPVSVENMTLLLAASYNPFPIIYKHYSINNYIDDSASFRWSNGWINLLDLDIIVPEL
jgi:hypothetical protein